MGVDTLVHSQWELHIWILVRQLVEEVNVMLHVGGLGALIQQFQFQGKGVHLPFLFLSGG